MHSLCTASPECFSLTQGLWALKAVGRHCLTMDVCGSHVIVLVVLEAGCGYKYGKDAGVTWITSRPKPRSLPRSRRSEHLQSGKDKRTPPEERRNFVTSQRPNFEHFIPSFAGPASFLHASSLPHYISLFLLCPPLSACRRTRIYTSHTHQPHRPSLPTTHTHSPYPPASDRPTFKPCTIQITLVVYPPTQQLHRSSLASSPPSCRLSL